MKFLAKQTKICDKKWGGGSYCVGMIILVNLTKDMKKHKDVFKLCLN